MFERQKNGEHISKDAKKSESSDVLTRREIRRRDGQILTDSVSGWAVHMTHRLPPAQRHRNELIQTACHVVSQLQPRLSVPMQAWSLQTAVAEGV